MAWTTAGSRSGMSGYELHDQLSEQFFRPAGGYFANFSSSVGSTSEEIYSQQAVYFSYTYSYVVESGLSEGDLVVVSGNFKIDSALQIQAKPSMMNPEGGGSGGGHDHGSR